MKKKFGITMMMMMIFASILACGSKATVLPADTEVAEELPTPEKRSEDLPDSNVESMDSIEESTDVEDTEQKEYTPSWYMDSEGIKNNELGIVIKKDKVSNCSFKVTFQNPAYQQSLDILSFWCGYYGGDLDSYIATECNFEGANTEKHEVNGVSYVCMEWENLKRIAFIGNGIMVSADIYDVDDNIDDYIKRIDLIKECNENTLDCLAYIADDGLYCPTLGINFLCDEKNVEETLFCADPSFCGSMWIRNESDANLSYMKDIENVQEVEINLGKCKYLGRGMGEDWLFFSDDTTWSISFSIGEGENYEDYISIIENVTEFE